MNRFLLLIVSLIVWGASTALSTPLADERQTEPVPIYAPAPYYPRAARWNRISGSGTVLLIVDEKSGLVTSAKMEKSTGHFQLDNAATDAFRQWRFKPGTAQRVHVPIRFELRRKG